MAGVTGPFGTTGYCARSFFATRRTGLRAISTLRYENWSYWRVPRRLRDNRLTVELCPSG